jgi:hypothetical protein
LTVSPNGRTVSGCIWIYESPNGGYIGRKGFNPSVAITGHENEPRRRFFISLFVSIGIFFFDWW